MCHKEMELEDPKDLRARFRKFLILTNERKQMSKMTMRKRISLIVVTALTTGVLTSVTTGPAANAHGGAVGTGIANNAEAVANGVNTALMTAEKLSTTGAVVLGTDGVAGASIHTNARSLGLLAKDTTTSTAQTATMLASGTLSLYANVSTAVAAVASSGTFGSSVNGDLQNAASYSQDRRTLLIPAQTTPATGVAFSWVAPSSAGTYTISWYYHANTAVPTLETPAGTLGSVITVTVVTATAGGTYSATTSACNTAAGSTAFSAGVYPNGIDSTATKANGDAWSIDFSLRDAYNAALSTGALTASATNGALINFGTSGATPLAGTTSTIVSTSIGVSGSSTVRVDQPTAGAPLTTTVTISYNGTVICTKTVTIRGGVDKLTVANVGTQDLNGSAGSAQWMYQEIGLYSAGLFTVLATDSAGNIVATPASLGAFSMDAATVGVTVPGLTFPTVSTSNSSSSTSRFTLGSFTCGANAGTASPVVQFTNAANGKVTKSAPFTARCADNADTYSAGFDKATYNNGDIATLTIKFLDSKGNPAQNVTAYGASSIVVPMMTAVSSASATSVTKTDGTLVLTYTVGLAAAAATPGTYAGIVTFDVPAKGATQSLKYSIVDPSGAVSNAEVLKSIVALIASINKQIQALQKLILQRR